MKTLLVKLTILGAMILPLMAGCKQLDSFSKEGAGASDAVSTLTGITLNMNFSSLLNSPPEASLPANSRSTQFNLIGATLFAGTVEFENTATSVKKTYDITGGVDSSWDAIVYQSFALQGGTYNITVDLSSDTQRYVGTISGQLITIDTTNDVALEIHPVIGHSGLDVTTATELPRYYFDYPAGDFDASTDTYLWEVTIDASTSAKFNIAEITNGIATFWDISDGTHDVDIRIYRDETTDVEVARFSGTPDFTAGTQQTLDLTPVFGWASFTMSEASGDATFDFKFDRTVYDLVDTEAADEFRLEFIITGQTTGATYSRTVMQSELLPNPDGTADQTLSFPISGVQFETMSIDLEVWDETAGMAGQIGTCSFSVALSKTGSTETCDLQLLRRAAITGRVLQVLGVNVAYDGTHPSKEYQPAPTGTTIYVTGTENYTRSTDANGHATIYLQPGTYSIYAGRADGTSDPVPFSTTGHTLENGDLIDNIMLWLKQ